MKFFIIFIFATVVLADNLIRYDTFTGNTLSAEEFKEYEKLNKTYWCSGSYKPCDPKEGRRLDVTCNNLKYPYRGPPHTPSSREVPLRFGEDNNPKKTKSGKEPGPARKERTQTLPEGTVPDPTFTSMTAHYMLFVVSFFTAFHDTVNYNRWTTHCCQPEGKKDPICYPMEVPTDDPVHQFSGIRCMNMTKPLTYQNVGCLKDASMKPRRINSASNFLDLSLVYGFDNSFRTLSDGLLQSEFENGREWPVSTNYPQAVCLLNQLPNEKRCHKFPHLNGLIGSNFFGIIFWRLHNYIARQLKELNPSWDDEKLFSTARDINIAICAQTYYYELMPDFLGKDNLIKDGVIIAEKGYRDDYDENLVPEVSDEYLYSLRWCHTIQPGMMKHYDPNGKYLKQIPSVNLTLRTGYFALGNHMEEMTQSCFRQPMSKIDQIVEPTMAETGLGFLQYAFDVPAADLIKGGLLGIGTYVQYRELCTGNKYTCFEDLVTSGDMKPEYVRVIQDVYEYVEDVPLMVGLWLENLIPGGHAPRTLYCLKARQMKKIVQYDRFWFENIKRPNVLSEAQLAQVRHATMAWVFCTVGDSVIKIQPKAFLLESPENQITSCANIQPVDLTPWKEESEESGNTSPQRPQQPEKPDRPKMPERPQMPERPRMPQPPPYKYNYQ